ELVARRVRRSPYPRRKRWSRLGRPGSPHGTIGRRCNRPGGRGRREVTARRDGHPLTGAVTAGATAPLRWAARPDRGAAAIGVGVAAPRSPRGGSGHPLTGAVTASHDAQARASAASAGPGGGGGGGGGDGGPGGGGEG